jgi:hypothetical protein
MTSPYSKKIFWKIIYIIWPPVLRAIELLGIHNFRQNFLLGHLNSKYTKDDFIKLLAGQDFELGIIAYKDPGEIVGMRRLDTPIYQYHIRLFIDGEIRAHYEYSPEARPLDHIFEVGFENRKDFFVKILGEYLVQN